MTSDSEMVYLGKYGVKVRHERFVNGVHLFDDRWDHAHFRLGETEMIELVEWWGGLQDDAEHA